MSTSPHPVRNGTLPTEANRHKTLAQPELRADRLHTFASASTIVIELAGEPKGKGRARSTRAGITYTPAATRSHENALAWAATRAMRGRSPLLVALQVTVKAYMSVPRSWSKRQQARALDGVIRPTTRPDADNILKMLDALNRIVWRDDAQIVCLELSKHYSERPRTLIEVIPL